MEQISEMLGQYRRNTEMFFDDERLEMCRRGARFKERVYEPPTVKDDTKCAICGDEGYRFFWYDGYEYAEECECHRAVVSLASIKKAGIARDMTFDNFFTDKEFQKSIKTKAEQYTHDGYLAGQWFYIGGQSGCGKTHICTAILNELIHKGVECKYMTWKEESVHLKSIVNNHAEYHERIMELCQIPMLYIDDFWKTQAGTSPTQADVNLAFQVLNFRYMNPTKVTIISSEYLTSQLLEIDEATAGRIIEKSRAYQLNIRKDRDKNYRLSGIET